MSLKVCLLFVLLVAAASAGPTGTRSLKCASECKDQSKFFYEQGKSYEYEYIATTLTTAPGQTEPLEVKVSALVAIQPVTPCEFVLSLSDVVLHDIPESNEFATRVTRTPLGFAFQDGKIEHVCGSDEEEPWVINFKKAILSNFQNSMSKIDENEVLTETDIFGRCETSYVSTRHGNEFLITRNKKPSECSNRPDVHQKLSTFGYSLDSLVQGLPLLDSRQECKQFVVNDIIERTECGETHQFQPFNKHKSGAEITTSTSLDLVAVKIASSPFLDSFSSRKDLQFAHPQTETKTIVLEDAETILSELELLTKNGVKKDVPGLFSELVASLRGLKQPQIHALYQSLGLPLKKIMVDALPLVGTADSVGEFVDLILNGEMSVEEQDVWFTSLAFISNPSLEMFAALEPLFEVNVKYKAMLGVSSMIHNYCQKDSKCKDLLPISKILKTIESQLGIGCRATSDNEKETILHALKAIGNAGHFINAESVLKRCYLEDNSMEIKIAAISAWRRTPCNYNHDHLLSSFVDQYQDNEVRIASYLALMKCPTPELIDTIKDRLTSESVNQVESFVWTHLTNLQESAAQDKQWIRQLIGEEMLAKKFSSESLKMSRNFESSFYLIEQQFGASVESNVIFSGKSYLPRSSMLDLTIDLFGETINLFEVGGRIEGFEAYIEKFFGPNGYYPEDTIAAIIKNLRQSTPKDETIIGEFLVKESDEPKGSVYLKMFGNEIFYKNFHEIENTFPDISFSNIFGYIMEVVTKGKTDFTKTYELINSEFTFPTITGFPINLNLNGVATVGLKVSGKYNFEDLTSIDIQGKIEPSAAVKMNANIAVNALVMKSGVKVISTLHSSSALEGKAIIKGGKLADIALDVPQKEVELFDMEYELYRIDSQGEKKIEIPSRFDQSCQPIISKSLGMELCFMKNIPTSQSFSWPLKEQVLLRKTDSHVAYVFRYSRNEEKTTLLLNMPESEIDKKWSASITHENQKYEIDILSPISSLNGMFSYVNGNGKVGVETRLIINERKVCNAKFMFTTEENNFERQYDLDVSLQLQSLNPFILSGAAVIDKEYKSINSKLKIEWGSKNPLTAKFKLNQKPGERSLDFGFTLNPLDVSLSGALGKATNKGTVTLKGQYSLYNRQPQSLTATIQYEMENTKERTYFLSTVDVEEVDFYTNIQINLTSTKFDGNVIGRIGKTTWDIKNYYDLITSGTTKELILKQKADIPVLGFIWILEKETVISNEMITNKRFFKLNEYKEEGEIVWNFGTNFHLESKREYGPNMSTSALKIEIKKVDERSYTLMTSQNYDGELWETLDASLSYLISNKFEAELKATYNPHVSNSAVSPYNFVWVADATTLRLRSDITVTGYGEKKFFTMRADPTSFGVSSNYPMVLSAEVKIESVDDEKRFEIKAKLDDETFETFGSLSPRSIEGNMKYKNKEPKLVGRILDHGILLEAQLSPSERFAFDLSYSLDSDMFFEVGLKTPFSGWEKQDARFSLKVGDVVQGQASITWRNVHHVNLIFYFSKQLSLSKTVINASCRFTSTFVEFEKLELSLKHSRLSNTIHTLFEGYWNAQVLKGSLDAFPADEGGYKIIFLLKSPIFEDVLASFDYFVTQKDLSTSLELVYGSQKSKMLLKGKATDFKNIDANFIMSGPFLPEISTIFAMKTSDTEKVIDIKGKVNSKKFMLQGICKTFSENDKNICNLDLKITANNSKVLIASFSKQINSKYEFESDIELSSDFISSQSFKGHLEGRFSSFISAALTGHISGPKIQGELKLVHEISDTKLDLELTFEFNTFRTFINMGGNINLKTLEGSLHSEIESTLKLLNGIKMTLLHNIQGDVRETYLTFSRNRVSGKIYNSFTFNDFLNWSGVLHVNDKYMLKTELSSSNRVLKHITNVSWFNNNIDFSFACKCSNQLEITATFNSPWTSLLNFSILHYKEGTIKKADIKIEYGNGRNISLKSEYDFNPVEKFLSLSLFNKDWNLTPLSLEFRASKTDRKTLDFAFNLNQTLMTGIQFFKDNVRIGGVITFKFNREVSPVSFIGKYSFTENEVQGTIEFEAKEKHIIDMRIIGDKSSGVIYLTSNLPFFFDDPLNNTVNYGFKEYPFHIKVTSILRSTTYHLETLLDNNKFFIRSNCPSGQGELDINWKTDTVAKTFTLKFISPFKLIKNIFLNLSYSSDIAKNVVFEFTYDVHKINFEGTFSSNLIEFDSKTTFLEWENVKMKIEIRGSEIDGIFLHNDSLIKITGEGNFETTKGEGRIRFITPWLEFADSAAYVTYAFGKGFANIDFEANIGSKVLKLFAHSELEEYFPSKLTLDIESPWEIMEKIMFLSTCDGSNVKIDGRINKLAFDSSMEFSLQGKKEASVMITGNSNIPNWTTFSTTASVNLVQKPYVLSIEVQKEDINQEYFLSWDISKDNVHLEVRTPIKPMQNIKVSGNYKYELLRIEASLMLTTNVQTNKIYGHIDLSKTMPDIKFSVSTPFTGKEIDFSLSGKISEEQSISFQLKIRDQLYKVIFEKKLSKFVGSSSADISLPIDGLRSLKMTFNYDLESIKKYVTLDLEKEGIKERFSAEGKFSSNEFNFELETPVEKYESLMAFGKYGISGNDFMAKGIINNNGVVQSFEGRGTLKENGFEFESTIPYYNLLTVTGEVTSEKIHFQFNSGFKKEEILISYSLEKSNAYIKVNTPFRNISYFAVGGGFDTNDNVIDGHLYFHRNTDRYEMNVTFMHDSMKMTLDSKVKLPSSNEIYYFNFYNDFESEEKQIGLLYGKENLIKKYAVEAFYNKKDHGYIKLYTPFPGYEISGFEYKFKAVNFTSSEVFVTLTKNSSEFTLGIQSQLKDDEVIFKIRTPFTNYEIFGVEGRIIRKDNMGEIKIFVGRYTFLFETCIRPDNFLFHLETPFEELKIFKLSSKYGWTTLKKIVLIEYIYNDIKYSLNGNGIFSTINPQISFKLISPLQSLKVFEVRFKFDLHSPSELLDATFKLNSINYGLSFGYQLEGLKANLIFNINTPIISWKTVIFKANIDLESSKKVIDIVYERENISKSIYFSGMLTDDDIGFDIKVPFDFTGNLKTRGHFNRAKRSTEFEMMNDQGLGEIIASFNSLKVTVKTPYQKASDVSFNLQKNKKGGWALDYKRNNDKAFINFVAEPKKKGLDITIESELPGWEFLALAGRIDAEEIIAYISGQKSSSMVQVSGTGLLGARTGSLSIVATSSLEQYQKVVTKIEYNAKRNIFTFESKSESSDFKILLEIKRGLIIDILIPNPQQNTVVKGKLGIFAGQFNLSSRFPQFRTVSLNYDVTVGPKIASKITLERNGVNIFELDFEQNDAAKTTHLMISGRRGENHSMLHIHREGWDKFEFLFKRNGREFKIDLNGSGNLPLVGTYQYSIVNSFREVPRYVTGKIDVDRSSAPKEVKLEVHWHTDVVYKSVLQYNIDLSNLSMGDFKLKTEGGGEPNNPWKDTEGNWKLSKKNEITAFLRIGTTEYKLNGTMGISSSDLTLASNRFNNTYILQWHFDKKKNSREYLLKVGKVDQFVMFHVKGEFDTIFNGDVSGSFRFSTFMQNDFNFTAKWSRTSAGLSGSGTYSIGKYKGTHTLLNFKRDPNQRAATFNWEATSNIQRFTKMTLIGEYSLARKLVDVKFAWDMDSISVKGALDHGSFMKSENTVYFHLPRIGDGQLTLSNDFTNPQARFIKLIGNIGNKNLSYVANWSRNDEFTDFNLNADIESPLFGVIYIHGDFNKKDIDNAHGNFEYKRNNDKYITIKWSYVKTRTNIAERLLFTSHFSVIPTAEIYLNADWSSGFNLDAGIKWRDQAIEAKLLIGPKNTTASVKTPFKNVGDINVNLDYDFQPKSKIVNFVYSRGDKVVTINFKADIVNKKTGSMTLSASSPFKILKNLSFNASWKKGKFDAEYKQNDKTITLSGDAEVKSDKSSFSITFTPTNLGPIHIEFSYDLEEFIKGKNATPMDLVHVKVIANKNNIEFNAKGYRTAEKIYIEINGSTSLEAAKSFHLKLDSELNLKKRNGFLEIRVDDFHFDMKNSFERLPNGFYAKSQIHSSISNLPGLTIGIGRDGDYFILTHGLGDEREITFKIKGKNYFKKGFSGTIDIPRRGLLGMEYDLDYSFKSDNKLVVNLKITVSEGKTIEANIIYDSDGIKGRLSSPVFGILHTARMRRSISDDHFMADVGIDHYGFTIEGSYDKSLFKKGFKIEGEIFGKRILIDTFLNVNTLADSEGKLIIETPFKNFEKLGGIFIIKLTKERLYAEVNADFIRQLFLKIDINLISTVRGDALFRLGELSYEVQCDFRTEDDIMKGQIILKTPHSSLERIIIDGIITDVSTRNFQAKFALEHPTGFYEMNIDFSVDSLTYKADITLYSNKTKLVSIASTYTFRKTPFYLNGRSLLSYRDEEILKSSVEFSYNTKNDITVDCELGCKNYLDGSLKLQVAKEYVEIGLMGTNPTQKKINITAKMSKLMDQVSVDVIYEGERQYRFIFQVQQESLHHTIQLTVNLPSILQGSFEMKRYKLPRTSFRTKLDTSGALSKLYLSFESFKNTDGNVEVNFMNEIEAKLPMCESVCKFHVDFTKTFSSLESNLKFSNGKDTHYIHGKYENISRHYNLLLNMDSSLLQSKKGITFHISCNFNNFFGLLIESIINDVSNNFYFELDRDYKLVTNCISPLIPTGMVTVQGELLVQSFEDFTFSLMVANAEKGMSVEGILKLNIDNKSKVYLEIRTPTEGYRKVEFGLEITRGDVTHITMYANPFSLEARSYFGVESSTFKAGIKLETGNNENGVMEVNAIMPLNKFSPKFTATIDGVEYLIEANLEEKEFEHELTFSSKHLNLPNEIGVFYRNKAPYEIDLAYKSQASFKFGIIFDSSVMTVIKELQYFLF